MRLTRAALRAGAEQLPSGMETHDASNVHTDEASERERVPLREVNTNTAVEPDTDLVQSQKMPSPNKIQAKAAAKKGAKGKKAKVNDAIVEVIEVLEVQTVDAPGPECHVAVDELAKEPTHVEVDVAPSPAVRMTRSQLAKQDELSRSFRSLAPPAAEPLEVEFEVDDVPEEDAPSNVPMDTRGMGTPPAEKTPAEAIMPSVEITSELEPKTLTSEKPYEEITTPRRTTSRRSSRSPSKSPMRLEESFEALDALEEALENVVGAIPKFDHSGDEKSPMKKAFPDGFTLKKSPQASKGLRVPSLAPKPLKTVPPNPTVRASVARASSVRAAPSKENVARKASAEVADYLSSKRRPVSMSFPAPPPPPKSTRAPTKPTFQLSSDAVAAKLRAQKEERLKREAVAGPTRPRPISMPPPPKSTKPPTKPNFQLPGDAIAAKLKAQKEERLRREAEGVEPAPRTTTLPAPPKSTKPPTVPNFQLPGEAVAAKLKAQKEERLRREAGGEEPATRPISLPPPPKSTKPPTIPNFQLPGEAIAAKLKAQKEQRLKREEEAEAARKAQAAAVEAARRAQAPTFKARPAPVRKAVAAPVRQTASSATRLNNMSNQAVFSASSSSTVTNKRSSLALSRTASGSTASSNRTSMLFGVAGTGGVGKSVVTPADAAVLKMRGKEVFNRDRQEKEQRERERKEKEEAAKRARAEAAERSRIASREWAEKQKRKMMAAVGLKSAAA